jgi:hypothetical protein
MTVHSSRRRDPINRRLIYCLAVAHGAEFANVKPSRTAGHLRNCCPYARRGHRGGDQGRDADELEKFPADPVHGGGESAVLEPLGGIRAMIAIR